MDLPVDIACLLSAVKAKQDSDSRLEIYKAELAAKAPEKIEEIRGYLQTLSPQLTAMAKAVSGVFPEGLTCCVRDPEVCPDPTLFFGGFSVTFYFDAPHAMVLTKTSSAQFASDYLHLKDLTEETVRAIVLKHIRAHYKADSLEQAR